MTTFTNWTFSVAGNIGPTGATGTVSLASPAFTGTPTAPTATAGTNTTQLATTEFVTTAAAGVTSGFRNLIINGDMRINQRNATVTANGYTVDRWKLDISNSSAAVSVAANTDVPTGQGFTSSLRMTTNTGGIVSSFGYIYLAQLVEGFNSAQLAWGTAGAKPATLSFWVRSSVAGVHTVTVVNGSETRFRPCLYTINAADTWEKKTVSVVGTTTGTWATGNTAGLRLYFFTSIGSGGAASATDEWSASSFGISGTVNDNATAGNIFAITGVQFEANPQPTPFEQRQYGTELALCQRYFWKLITNGISYLSFQYAGTQYRLTIPHPVQMRTNPHSVVTTTWQGGTTPSLAAASVLATNWTTTSGWFYVDSSTFIEISAEL